MRLFRKNRIGYIKIISLLLCCLLLYVLIKLVFISDPRGNVGDISLKYYTDLDNIVMNEEQEESFTTTRGNIIRNTVIKTHEETTQVINVKSNHEVMLRTVKKLNKQQMILNQEIFPKRSKDSIVIVIQVHERIEYLRKLIGSLKKTRGISDALLIFSHDHISQEMNSLVRSINFCQVMQIYFPYSMQLHPNKYPGHDPNDCPRNQKVDGCINAAYPDMYGHYREAHITMTKHHWWWKANRVFNDLLTTKQHGGLVLFLEEDHYVAPDFYQVLQKAYQLKKTTKHCKGEECDIITIGDYRKIYTYQGENANVLLAQKWQSSKHNMGMAFDRQVWNKISKCSKPFCEYDDYNWDWTLMKLSVSCITDSLTMLLVKLPRVFHLGTCGLHHKNGDCNVERIVNEIDDLISNGVSALHPEKLVVQDGKVWVAALSSRPNGGWADIRDHQLCLQFTKTTE